MIEKVITIASLDEDTSQQDLAYWLSRPSEERLAAVQLLRERVFDLPQPIERILEIARAFATATLGKKSGSMTSSQPQKRSLKSGSVIGQALNSLARGSCPKEPGN